MSEQAARRASTLVEGESERVLAPRWVRRRRLLDNGRRRDFNISSFGIIQKVDTHRVKLKSAKFGVTI